jgi:hypothetical protein
MVNFGGNGWSVTAFPSSSPSANALFEHSPDRNMYLKIIS